MMNATDLVLAAQEGDLMRVQEILTLYPTRIDICLRGCTALHASSRAGHIEIMKTLIFHNPKPDLDFPDSKNSTPLHYAVKADQAEAVLLLLKSGANADEEDDDGKTPFMIACGRNYEDCMNSFKERGNVNLTESLGTPPSSDEERELVEVDETPPKPKSKMCKYCKKNERYIKFEPCGCIIACFECSFSKDLCKKCGKFVEKCSYERTPSYNLHCSKIKLLRKEVEVVAPKQIKMLKDKVSNLECWQTCKICYDSRFDCMLLDCGHVFCKQCVRKTKDANTCYPEQNWVCAVCNTASIRQDLCTLAFVLCQDWDSFFK